MVTRNLFAAVVLLSLAVTVTPLSPSHAAVGYADEQPMFDVQAHRGGIGLTVENTPPSFDGAIRLGVTTLELDVQITQDGEAVVTHDRRVIGAKCQDTAPVAPGDPEYPYVGKYVNTLTLSQVRTLDCGSKTLPQFPGQQASPGERMPLLGEVFDLVNAYDAHDVQLNVETKVEAGAPSETAPREEFVQVVDAEIRAADIARQVTIQSFDWGALMRMQQGDPRLPLVALRIATSSRSASPARRRGWAASTSTTSAATSSRRQRRSAPGRSRRCTGSPRTARSPIPRTSPT